MVRSVELKAGVVSDDEREAGKRQILNFGHTLGHALEAALDYGMPHGSAVSVGMVLEARLGRELGVTAPGTEENLREVLESFGLPVELPQEIGPDEILAFCRTDKKARAGRTRFVLLKEAGRVARDRGWSRAVPEAAVREILESARRPAAGGGDRASREGKNGR